MFIQSLRRRAPRPVLAALLLLLPPSAVSAQPAQGSEKSPQWVSITVDYVETTLLIWKKSSSVIAAGPKHDTQLLAALVKNGAADTKGLPVFCTDGSTMERRGPVSASPGTLRRRIRRMPFQFPDRDYYLDSRTKATAKFNSNGTVMVTLAASLAVPFPPEPPIFSVFAMPTFRDGQTLVISRTLALSANEQRVSLVFARMTVGNGPMPLPLIPSPADPNPVPRVLFPSAPYSVDPGMVAAPPVTGDEGMAGGRGMDPQSIDHMNALVLPATPAPKHK